MPPHDHTRRKMLPNRRGLKPISFQLHGKLYVAAVVKYGDRRLAEVVLRSGKISSTTVVIASDLAVCTSLELQFGFPAESLRHVLSQDEAGGACTAWVKLLDLLDEV
jgi:hypothetical protein